MPSGADSPQAGAQTTTPLPGAGDPQDGQGARHCRGLEISDVQHTWTTLVVCRKHPEGNSITFPNCELIIGDRYVSGGIEEWIRPWGLRPRCFPFEAGAVGSGRQIAEPRELRLKQ